VADYLLDTNIVRYWYDTRCAQHARVAARVAQVRQPDPNTAYVARLFISVVTLAEIEYGHAVTLSPDMAAQAAYRKFLAEELPPAIEISRHIHEPYSKLRAWLFNNCSPRTKRGRASRAEELANPTTSLELGIDENDLWIAAHAALHGLVLVTHDRLSNLARAIQNAGVGPVVEDWTGP